jgi:urease accessory protein UreE
MRLRVPGSGDVPIPLVHPKDAGNFVQRLLELPTGMNMLAFGDRLPWTDYVKLVVISRAYRPDLRNAP